MKLPLLTASIVMALSLPLLASAAPTKADREELKALIDNAAADDLGELRLCNQEKLRSDYLQSLLSAALRFPNTDPAKVSALIRQIDRRGDVLYEMRAGWQKDQSAKYIAEHCEFAVRQARKHLTVYDDYIFKS